MGTYDNAVKNTFVQAFGIPSVSSIAAGAGSSLALDGVGQLWAAGLNNYGQLGTGDNNNRSAWVQVYQ